MVVLSFFSFDLVFRRTRNKCPHEFTILCNDVDKQSAWLKECCEICPATKKLVKFVPNSSPLDHPVRTRSDAKLLAAPVPTGCFDSAFSSSIMCSQAPSRRCTSSIPERSSIAPYVR